MKEVCAALAAFVLFCAGAGNGQAREPLTLTDLAGRQVMVRVPVERIILGEGRHLPAIGILDREDPTRRIAGMGGDLKQLDPSTYAQYRARFPQIEDIPLVGQSSASSFSIEQAIHSNPDVAIFSLSGGHGPTPKQKVILDRLAAAGIPVAVIDFRDDPLRNTPLSMSLLGKLMGREAEAREFLEFYGKQLDLVRDRLAGVDERPHVFLESRVGIREECCETIGDGMLGRFIEWAGGINMGASLVPGAAGMVNVEQLIVAPPDVYLATAIGSTITAAETPNRIVLGAGAGAGQARESLARSMARTGIAQLPAVRNGDAHAIWHHFYNTPINVVAVQAIAKWLHPGKFGDLDPRQTLETFFERFQPVPLDGVYWTSLSEEGQ